MPFAKFLYEAAQHAFVTGDYPNWEHLTEIMQKRWEDYARVCATYFVR